MLVKDYTYYFALWGYSWLDNKPITGRCRFQYQTDETKLIFELYHEADTTKMHRDLVVEKCVFTKVVDNKIVETFDLIDFNHFQEQLGIAPI